jgi:hypothetical protein
MDRLETHPLPMLATPLGQVEADLLVVPAFEGDDFADLAGLDAATGGEAGRAITNHEFSGKPYELFLTPVTHNWKARRVALVGAGPRARFDADLARRVATTGVLAARARRISRVVVLFRTSGDPSHPSRTRTGCCRVWPRAPSLRSRRVPVTRAARTNRRASPTCG